MGEGEADGIVSAHRMESRYNELKSLSIRLRHIPNRSDDSESKCTGKVGGQGASAVCWRKRVVMLGSHGRL